MAGVLKRRLKSKPANMDPRRQIKRNEWSDASANAIHLFNELRVLFVMEELCHCFPVILEYYLRSEIHQRLAATQLKNTRAEFHIQTMINYLEESSEGVFVIERHLPPDLPEDRRILLEALDNVLERSSQ